jgi:hypothetical protein
MLDLLLFIVVLGVCLAVSFTIVTPMTKDDINTDIVDKTAPQILGYGNKSSFDGTSSKMEVILSTQVQDFSIPDPKRYKVGSSMINIGSTYEGEEQDIAELAYTELSKTDPNGEGRYEAVYEYGVPPTVSDYDSGNLVANGGGERSDSSGRAEGWTGMSLTSGNVNFTTASQSEAIAGSSSLKIETTPNTSGVSYSGTYYQDITVEGNTKYRVSGALRGVRTSGDISFEVYGPSGVLNKLKVLEVSNNSEATFKTIEFTTPLNTDRVRILITKGDSNGSESGKPDQLIADRLSLQKMDGSEPHYLVKKK